MTAPLIVEADGAYDLTSCDREPIHRSGSIQPHGALMVVRERDLSVVQASENLVDFLGIQPSAGNAVTAGSAVIGGSVGELLGAATERLLVTALTAPGRSGADPLPLRTPSGALFDLTWHRLRDDGDNLLLLEVEAAQPSGPTLFTTIYEDTRAAMDALHGNGSVAELCRNAAIEVRRLTGYDRVMVYRFHPDEHGEVVAEELVAGLKPFLGLHYPATDIPQQARRLFLLNRVRVIDDVAYTPALVLPATTPAGEPLDLSQAALRSVSPVHLQYLSNMGVRASMTIALFSGSALWGLVACHHYAGSRHIHAQLRAACALLGQMFSLQVVAEEELEALRHRERLGYVEAEVVAAMAGAESLARGFVDGNPLRLAAADGLVAHIDGETQMLGIVPPQPALDALLAELRSSGPRPPAASVQAYDDLPARFPAFVDCAELASGALAIALSPGYADAVIFFRGEYARSVSWAGDPAKPIGVSPTDGAATPGLLTPRSSFAEFLQAVRGRSRPWSPGELAGAAALARLFPELLLARARRRLARAAMYDGLTGSPNRVLVYDRIDHALQSPWLHNRRPALLFLDLDRFKTINDSLGHGVGDEVLSAVADRLRSNVREPDTAGRIGGDEFVVFCDRVGPGQAAELADRLVRAFREPLSVGDRRLLVTASIGFALAEPASTAADLLSDADTAMYKVKHSGRDGSAAFTPELRALTVRRTDVETRMRSAVDNGELSVYYQPIFRMTGQLHGFEALARWRSPELGLIPPSEFIPVVEDLGLIERVTADVLETGLRHLARWRLAGGGEELTLSVNISARQMTAGLLRPAVGRALSAHGLPPEALCLEITEGALVSHDEISHRFLQELNDLGVRLSIDDFGTGFSSLSYLAHLPVHELKIDRAFIEGLAGEGNDATVIASVVQLAHQLGIVAVAEGVETAEQLDVVRRLECDLVQGYWTARPTPPEHIDLVLHELMHAGPWTA